MAREGAIEAEGAVVELLTEGTYRVRLANGHQLLAFVAGHARWGFARLRPGEKVRLRLSPCDLSVGRIIVKTQRI